MKAHFTYLTILCWLCMSIPNFGIAQTAIQPTGNGSTSSPYLISNLSELYWISQNSSSWDKQFQQTANINASSSSGWDAGRGWSPIGNSAIGFSGSYDGGSFSISNLSFDRQDVDFTGFFGVLTGNAVVTDMNLNDADFKMSHTTNGEEGDYVGILAGITDMNTIINNCTTSGDVEGYRQVGGLVGQLRGSTQVTNCNTTVNVTSKLPRAEKGNNKWSNAGGLAGSTGSVVNVTISNCNTYGSVTGENRSLGGFIGHINEAGSYTNCYANVNVDATNSYQGRVGGFVGQVEGTATLKNCVALGNVSAAENTWNAGVGAFVGRMRGQATIDNAYAKGNVSQTGSSPLGGFAGDILSSNQITNSYTTANVTSGNAFIGENEDNSHTNVINSFWNTDTANTTTSQGGSGKTAEELKLVTTYLEADWDFLLADAAWALNRNVNGGFPFLRFENETPSYIWLAENLNNDFENPANWSENTTPTSSNVIIPSLGASNSLKPIISEDIIITNLTLETSTSRLEVDAQASLSLTQNIVNNGIITFKSNRLGDSYFGEFSGNITGIGSVVSEKYYPNKRAFRMVTSSLNTTSTIYDNWQNEGLNTSGIGTHITGSTSGANGFDATLTGNASMFYFNNGWQAISNTNVNTLTAGEPYRLMIRGDRNVDLTNNTSSSSTTLITEGNLFYGATTYTPITATTGGKHFSFIGNPFQSKIDISALTQANSTNYSTNFYYAWDPMINTRGGFVTIDLSDGSNVQSSSMNQIIEPGQAFFLEALSATPSISILENVKTITTVPRNSSNNSIANHLKLQLLNNQSEVIDGIGIRFSEGANNNIDLYDAAKMGNLDENLALFSSNQLLSIEERTLPEQTELIPIFTNNWRASTYSFSLTTEGLTDQDIFIVDHYLNTETLLNQDYVFQINSNDTNSSSNYRFSLKISSANLDSPQLDSNSPTIYPNPVKSQVMIQLPNDSYTNSTLEVWNVLGKVVVNNTIGTQNLFTLDVEHLASGIYVLKISNSAGVTYQTKLIKE